MEMIKHRVFGVAVVFLGLLAGDLHEAQATESRSYNLSDGVRDRTYLLYRPASLGRQTPAPLVIVLHGGFGSGKMAENSYHWDELADRQGFIVVYPDGMRHSWNAGGICCGPALRDNVDDVGFITRLIHAVSGAENIDSRRVYLTGISNGAALAYRYACEGTFPVAAIGPVAGSFSFPCSLPHPVSVIAIHGLDDRHVPFAGGQGTKGVTKGSWMSVPQTLDLFRSVDRCQPPTMVKEGPVQTAASKCMEGRDVVLITIEGAGHQWPGAKPKTGMIQRILQADPPSAALDATTTLWRFFQNHAAQP